DDAIKINATLEWHWRQIEDENARWLLTLAAAYGEAAEIPLARLSLLTGLKDDPDGWDDVFSDAMKELDDTNLVERLRDGAAIRLHPLIRDYTRRKVPDFAQKLAEGAVRLVAAYRTPEILVEQAGARGFLATLEDLRETREALPEAMPGLRELERYFDWE